jgi:hypothetical protein
LEDPDGGGADLKRSRNSGGRGGGIEVPAGIDLAGGAEEKFVA